LQPAQPNVTYGNDGELNENGPDTTSQAMGYDQAGELCWVYSSTVSSPSCSSAPSGSTSYSYDADGERTTVVPSSGSSQAYAWNAANELRCANTNGSTCSISSPTSTTTLYAYDGDGLRASSTINSTSTAYTWDTVQSLPRLAVSGSTSYVYGYGPTAVVQINGSASDMLLADPLGSVHGLVQLSSGSLQNLLVNYTDYDTYGVPSNTGVLTQGHTSINANWSVTSSIGFAGTYEDGSGLVYMQHRYYDPTTGQFMSVDPMLQSTEQAYEYAGDDPIFRADPTGLWSKGCNAESKKCPWGITNIPTFDPPTITSVVTVTGPLPYPGTIDLLWRALLSITPTENDQVGNGEFAVSRFNQHSFVFSFPALCNSTYFLQFQLQEPAGEGSTPLAYRNFTEVTTCKEE
jgi:RHS repeat-associated protein